MDSDHQEGMKRASMLLGLLLTITVGVALFFLIDLRAKLDGKQVDLETLESRMREREGFWRDKENGHHAKITLLQSERLSTFAELETKDSLIRELQKTVKRYENRIRQGGAVIQVESETAVGVQMASDSVGYNRPADPVYYSHHKLQGWGRLSIRASRDSTTLDLHLRNRFHVVIGSEFQGLFKPRRYYAEIVNQNPYTETVAMRAYSLKNPKVPRWGIGLSAGCALTLQAGTPRLSPYLGVGVHYHLVPLPF